MDTIKGIVNKVASRKLPATPMAAVAVAYIVGQTVVGYLG